MPNKHQTFSRDRLVINDALREHITECLNTFERRPNKNPDLRQAAVAFTIAGSERDDSATFLLTRRAKHLNRHSGQYALPGGRQDPPETVIEASLRELHEELGINLGEENVLGLLDDYQTRSGFNITPVVVWAGANVSLKPDANEIARVYRIPLNDLKSPDIPILESTSESEFPVLSTPLATLGHQVFAPTAAFIFQFREIVLFGRHTRVAHLDQPKFAWK